MLSFRIVIAHSDVRLVKIVYCVPSDREPHEDYDERLGYVFRKLQAFYREEMERYGFVDDSGNGKTFQMEEDASGNVIVHLIDHSPDGNYPDPSKTVDLYRSNVGVYTGQDIANHLPSDFEDHVALVIITDMTEVQEDHLVHYGTNGGMGESGPGKKGIVYLTDQIMGIDETHSYDYPPRQFHAIGKNDTEQIAILKDTRFTNICDWSRPFARNATSSYNPDEKPDPANSMVWEYSSVVIGVIAHELGHALALPHCIRMTESVDPGVYFDFNIMGNGFRNISVSLFPEGTFSESEQYSRIPGDVIGFGSKTILNRRNCAALNRNQFMNSGIPLPDTDKPEVQIHSVEYDALDKEIDVSVTVNEAEGETSSGLSHLNYLLDWNVHKTVSIPEGEAYDVYEGTDVLGFNPGESANQGYLDYVLYKGLHTITVAAMDRCGNPSAPGESIYHLSIGEDRINDWLIWSRYFDGEAIVGSGSSIESQLIHDYLSKADEDIIAREGEGNGNDSWRRFHTGDYVNIVDKLPEYFRDAPEWSYRRICYASAHLISNRERNLNIRFGYDDFIQLFLNGKQIFVDENFDWGHNGFDPNQYQTVPVTIKEGENHLLVKSFNHMHGGGFHVFFEETGGDPVKLSLWPPEDPEILAIRNSSTPYVAGNAWLFY